MVNVQWSMNYLVWLWHNARGIRWNMAVRIVTGIGKTTLFRMMLGFIEPTSGQVAVGGELCFVPQGNRPCSSSPTAPPSGNCVTRWSDFKP
jgi:ABC-type thiamine transport system ATPase subunit